VSDNDFGKYIKSLREQKGYSVNQLAIYSEVSAAQISRIETGQRGVPKPETIQKLAKGLKRPYKELMRVAGHIEDGSDLNKYFPEANEGEENVFFKNWESLSEEDKKQALDYIQYLKDKAERENKKSD
jgi:transcriptional regulator with XRE-family HTH domain